MNFEYYMDNRKEVYDDSSSDDKMGFESSANSVMKFDNPWYQKLRYAWRTRTSSKKVYTASV